ncbi:MAG: beta-propeller fold lactonase family protein [Planctomycetaceae bacterium]|nr:beta-propeller fold lactonase family protein [Planctomycetaceae bacterium]
MATQVLFSTHHSIRVCQCTLQAFAVLCVITLLCSHAAVAGQSAGLLAVHPDGSRLACSNRDSGTVTILELPGLKKLHEVPVGHHPEGICWIAGTHQLACCVYGDDQIAIIDAVAGQVDRRVKVFDEPYGIVSDSTGQNLYATLEYPGQVIRVETESGRITAEWSVGSFPRGIALTDNDRTLYGTEYLTARLLQVDATDGKVTRSWEGASTDNLARQVVLSPNQHKAYLPHIRSRITAAHGNGSIFPYVSVANIGVVEGAVETDRIRVPMDSIQGARVTANPWDVEISPDGKRLFVVFAGTNEMYVCRALDDGYRELDFEANVPLGSNPRAVRVHPDGESVFVYNALDFTVVQLSVPGWRPVATAQVTKNPLPEDVLLGKQLFYTALQPMSSRRWISCSSCHPDGDADGRTWQQPEGLRQTQPLAGLKHTHPLHWSADRDEVQDFEHTIQGLLMQGRGLLPVRPNDALGKPLAGRSAALDALAAYTNSHQFSLSPHAANGLSESARRGQQLFQSERTGCAKCHSGPWYSDSGTRENDQFLMHDVGTGNDDASELMGPKYDTPTLLGVYRSAPYLHHGRAATLRDVLTTQNKDDRHGTTSTLNNQEIDDLVEFLKALPFE